MELQLGLDNDIQLSSKKDEPPAFGNNTLLSKLGQK